MSAWTAFYGALAVLTTVGVFRFKGAECGLRLAALFMLATWGCTVALIWVAYDPYVVGAYALLHLAGFVFFIGLWLRAQASWKALLAITFVLSLCVDIAAGAGPTDAASVAGYHVAQNMLFAFRLLVIGGRPAHVFVVQFLEQPERFHGWLVWRVPFPRLGRFSRGRRH